MENTQDPYRSVALAMRRLNAGSNQLRLTLAADLGVGAAEMRALTFINEAAEITPKELSVLLDITTGSMTAMIDRLEAASLVSRHPHPTDRRSLLLELTPGGRHAIQWAQDVFEKAIAAAYHHDGHRDPVADAAFLELVANAINDSIAKQGRS